MKQINIRWPEIEAEAMQLFAEKYGMTQSELVRSAVQDKILGKTMRGKSTIAAYKELIKELRT